MTSGLTRDAELDLSIVLPAHNEIALLGSTVVNLVSGVSERGLSFEIIIVENGSRDGTLRLAHLLAAQLPQVRVITQPKGDYGAALEAGIAAATGRAVATFDVDFYDLSFLDQALDHIERNGAGLVVASKRAPGADDRRPLSRRALTWAFASTLHALLSLEVSDAHGMKLIDRAELAPIAAQATFRDSVFDVELVLRAERAGVTVVEIPVAVSERRPPRTSIWRRSARTALDLLRLRSLLGAETSGGRSGRTARARSVVTGRVAALRALRARRTSADRPA